MRKITTTLLTVLTTLTFAFGQTQNATTESGKKVTLFPDGTWKYVETKSDTAKKTSITPTTSATTTPPANCNYSKNETDEFTGKKKLVVKEEPFIKFTSDELKKYYKNKDYVSCQLYCARIADTKVIYLYWKLLTKESYKYFGTIDKGAKLMIKFKNGEILELQYAKYDSGDTNYDYEYTTYSSYIVLDDDQMNKLQSNEIDKVRMYWSKGYEEYPAFNSSILINQLPCIK